MSSDVDRLGVLLRTSFAETNLPDRPCITDKLLGGNIMASPLGLWLRRLLLLLALGTTAALAGCDMLDSYGTEKTEAGACPQGFGWAEGLPAHFAADARFPTAFGADS